MCFFDIKEQKLPTVFTPSNMLLLAKPKVVACQSLSHKSYSSLHKNYNRVSKKEEKELQKHKAPRFFNQFT